jgi:superfamily I DNA and RNA helicase
LTVAVRSHAVADVEAVRQFLRNEFQVIPSVGNLRDQVKSTNLRLSDGMAEWVPRIQHASNSYLIQATAGSGKTQLALRLLNDTAAEKLNAMYVCFNRPLADMMAKLAPTRAKVTSFHELAVDYYRRHYQDPDFSEQHIFQRITNAYLQDSDTFPAQYDLLIIDETQDFDPLWMNAILQQLKPDGRLYVMVDDAQRLYEREAFDLPDAVTIQCNDNYRSPRAVCQIINALELTIPAIQSKSPYVGEYPQFLQYHDVASLLSQTEHAVNDLLKSGFALQDIVILTGAGLTSSKLFKAPLLGKMSLRKFTNTYNRNGDPVWTTGDLVLETLYRFKGQSAPAVVLTEMDFETFSQHERNKLFVGMTRAQMSLTVILSEQATARVSSLL